MINNISNSIHTPLNPPSGIQHPSLNNNQEIINNITQVYNQPLFLEQLPTEIIQNIAFNLETDSYAQLRLASRKMKDILPSFKTMLNRLEHGCSGEVKKNYELMYERSITERLENEKNDYLLQAISHVFVGQRYSHNNYYEISTHYRPIGRSVNIHWDCDILIRCSDIITISPHNNYAGKYTISGGGSIDGKNAIVSTIGFHNKKMNKDTINIIFKSFNDIFTKNNTNSRLIVAISAHKLRDYLATQRLNDFSKKDIDRCVSQHPILFKAGKVVADYISTKKRSH